jgi:DNA-binding NarL/FixJ family response regulator
MKKLGLLDPLPVKQITVLLAEDHAGVRKSLRLLVELDGDIQVIGEAKNGAEAVQLARSLHPDVIVMDLAMPLLTGLQATRQIMSASPAIRILILSAHPDPEYIKEAMASGASGYLIKQSSTQLLALAVREVLKGNVYFGTLIPKNLRDQCQKLFHKQELIKRKASPDAFLGLVLPS